MDLLRFKFICQSIDSLIEKYSSEKNSSLTVEDNRLLTALVSEFFSSNINDKQVKIIEEKLNSILLKVIENSPDYDKFNILINMLYEKNNFTHNDSSNYSFF